MESTDMLQNETSIEILLGAGRRDLQDLLQPREHQAWHPQQVVRHAMPPHGS